MNLWLGWGAVGIIAAVAALIVLAVLVGGWIWYRHTARMPVDDMVELVADRSAELPTPPADDTPWGPAALDGLVAAYDWDKAEQQMPRKLRRDKA